MAWKFNDKQWQRKWRERRGKIINAVVSPWTMIVNSFSWIGRTITAAWASRHFRFLIQGFPALFAIVGVGALVANAQTIDRAELAKKYLQAGVIAVREEKFESAQSYLEKAITLEGSNDETKFTLALVLDMAARNGLNSLNAKKKDLSPDTFKKLNDEFEKKKLHSYFIMRSLAPDNATGYTRAHIWMGDFIDQRYQKSFEALRAMENHYHRAYLAATSVNTESQDSADSALRLGTLCFGLKRADEAIKYLEVASDKYPYSRLVLAAAYQMANRPADRDRNLQRLAAFCKTKLNANVNDKEARLYLVSVLVQLEQFSEAIVVLRDGITHDRNDVSFLGQIADVFAAWEQHLSKKPGASIKERLALIQQGLQARPVHFYHLGRLLEFSDMKGEEGEEARKIMEDMLVKGQSAPIIHYLMGNRAYGKGDQKDAEYHWEKAFKLDPTTGAVANNLAWILSHKKDPDLDRALEIIEQCIKKMPNVENFFGTRGEIRSKMGRHKEALPDLERGLRASPNDASIHDALAETHKALGNVSMADLHKRKAEEIRAAQPKRANELFPGSPDPNNPAPALPTNTPVQDNSKPKVEEPKSNPPESKSKGG